jgi:hypothetical protein
VHTDSRKVAQHMREFGLTILGRAAYDVTFSEMSRPFAHAISVCHAAHGAEIAIKARIAQEHPLLLFTALPKSSKAEDQLTVTELFVYGRTIQFQDLPEHLWATTGIRMGRVEHYQQFGKLRNTITHFAVPDLDFAGETLKFLFQVMEPLVRRFWDKSILPYAGEWDEVTVSDGYLEEQLVQYGIEITPELRAAIDAEKSGTH